MRILFSLIFFYLITSIALFAQPFIHWQEAFGGSNRDGFYSIQQTVDGGCILAGQTLSDDGDVSEQHGKGDYWVVKLSSNGDLQWQRSLGGSDVDEAHSVKVTQDGGYIVVGETSSGYPDDGDVTGHHNNSDYWVVKLDQNGAIQWQKAVGGSLAETAEDVLQTNGSGYVVVGYTLSTDGDLSDNKGKTGCWMVKLDTAGNIQWQKIVSEVASAYSMQPTSDGGFALAGSTYAYVPGHHGAVNIPDFWVAKLDSLGVLQWQKSLGGSAEDVARSIQVTSDGGYFLAGYSKSNDGDVSGHHGNTNLADYWVCKLDQAGNIQWQKSLGGKFQDEAQSVVQTKGGAYVVAGYASSNDGDVSGNHGQADYWIVKLDTSGAVEWQKALGGSQFDYLHAMQLTNDEGIILTGSSFSQDGDATGTHNGSWDAWVVKLDVEAPCDVKENGCLKFELLSITQDPAGRKTYRIRATNFCSDPSIYTAIQVPVGVVAVAPADNTTITTPGGRLYAVRNPNESPIYSIRFKCVGAGIANGQSDVFTYTLPAQAAPAYINVVARLDPNLYYEAYLNVFNCPVGTTPDAAYYREQGDRVTHPNWTIYLYPNPARDVLQIDLGDLSDAKAVFWLWNSQGTAVQQDVFASESRIQTINLPEQLPAGLYFLDVQNADGKRRMLRFVVE